MGLKKNLKKQECKTIKAKFVSIKLALMLIITAIVLIAVSSMNNVYAYFMATESVTNEFSINPGTPYKITGEVIGENGTISGVPETVYEGNDKKNDVYITPSEGYRIATARLYTGDEIDEEYDETKKVAYLGIQATTENVVKVGTTNYPTITSAISIPDSNDITFDMQGYTLKYSGTYAAIVNNATLTIIDSQAATSTTIGYIDNFQGPAIENKGTLTIGTNDGTLQTRATKIIGATYGIVSTQTGATLNFYDGTIEGQTAPVNGTITTDTTLYTLTNGTEVRTYGTSEITYNTTYLVE